MDRRQRAKQKSQRLRSSNMSESLVTQDDLNAVSKELSDLIAYCRRLSFANTGFTVNSQVKLCGYMNNEGGCPQCPNGNKRVICLNHTGDEEPVVVAVFPLYFAIYLLNFKYSRNLSGTSLWQAVEDYFSKECESFFSSLCQNGDTPDSSGVLNHNDNPLDDKSYCPRGWYRKPNDPEFIDAEGKFAHLSEMHKRHVRKEISEIMGTYIGMLSDSITGSTGTEKLAEQIALYRILLLEKPSKTKREVLINGKRTNRLPPYIPRLLVETFLKQQQVHITSDSLVKDYRIGNYIRLLVYMYVLIKALDNNKKELDEIEVYDEFSKYTRRLIDLFLKVKENCHMAGRWDGLSDKQKDFYKLIVANVKRI
jgi:hypothetical protein